MQPSEIYGLDIETDTSRNGLDPAVAPVLRVALSGHRFDEVFSGDERTILADLDQRLATLRPGVIATWNGSAFDLPFIADRARVLGMDLGLCLCPDRRLTPRRAPLPGHAGAYRGRWYHHSHLDTYRLYGDGSPSSHWRSLRTIGRVLGLGGATSSLHGTCDLANEALHAHALSDARLARVLAQRRWSSAVRLVDTIDATEVRPVAVAAGRIERLNGLDSLPTTAPVVPLAAGI